MVYAALLRGINVGGNNKLNMKELTGSFESVGCSSVTTYINSGNIVFVDTTRSTAELEEVLEKVIKRDFNLSIPVLIRDMESYSKMIKQLPEDWQNDKQTKSDVMFLWDEAISKNLLNTLPLKPEYDAVIFTPGEVLWSVERINQGKSGMQKLVGTKLYRLMTIRNVNTTRKIYEIMLEKNSSSTA